MHSILRNSFLNILLILKKEIIDYIRFEFNFFKHWFFKINNILHLAHKKLNFTPIFTCLTCFSLKIRIKLYGTTTWLRPDKNSHVLYKIKFCLNNVPSFTQLNSDSNVIWINITCYVENASTTLTCNRNNFNFC